MNVNQCGLGCFQRLHKELPLSLEDLENVFDALDADGNGFLTPEEFTAGFSKFQWMRGPIVWVYLTYRKCTLPTRAQGPGSTRFPAFLTFSGPGFCGSFICLPWLLTPLLSQCLPHCHCQVPCHQEWQVESREALAEGLA